MTVRSLSFHEVDGLGFAATNGRADAARAHGSYTPTDLGPILELLQLAEGGRLPDAPPGGSWIKTNSAMPMIVALKEQYEFWLEPRDHHIGFIRMLHSGPDGDDRLVSFLMDAQRAARDIARLPGKTPGYLVAAMRELENNIQEHSEAYTTGILAFRAAEGVFEFVVADRELVSSRA